MSTDSLIILQNVVKTVHTHEGLLGILNGVSLTIHNGESVAIVGTSGSGKTTLLGLMAGLDLPSSGTVMIDDVAINELDEEARADLRGRWIGFVFQSFHLLPSLTALENVMLPLELKGMDGPKKQAEDWLHRVNLSERAGHYPNQLSGGEQQRVAIARAFAAKPKILFADEPTGNLDKNTSGKITELLFHLNHSLGTTLVLVTHDQDLAKRCQRQLHLEDGLLLDTENSQSGGEGVIISKDMQHNWQEGPLNCD